MREQGIARDKNELAEPRRVLAVLRRLPCSSQPSAARGHDKRRARQKASRLDCRAAASVAGSQDRQAQRLPYKGYCSTRDILQNSFRSFSWISMGSNRSSDYQIIRACVQGIAW